MTPPSVSEEMIRAAVSAWKGAFVDAPYDEQARAHHCMSAALTAALAHLPAGSEAVKPVAWIIEGLDSGRCLTEDENFAIFCAERGKSITHLVAAPPSTPPAANVHLECPECGYGVMCHADLLRSKQAPTVAGVKEP